MFHRPTLLTSTCTKEVEVSLTPTLILERRAGSEKSRQKPEFGHRVLIERPVLRALGSRMLIPPGGWVGMQVKIRKLRRRNLIASITR